MSIATVSRDLTAQKRSEGELRHLNETLEQRVVERTAELAEANDRLQAQMIERERADIRLQEVQLELFRAARLSTAGQMAAVLAHELNQPLAAVTNSIHAVRRLLAADDPKKKVDRARGVGRGLGAGATRRADHPATSRLRNTR